MFLMPRKCPTCKKTFSLHNYNKSNPESLWESNPYFPFCSSRCKSIDLLGWISEEGISIEDLLSKEKVDETLGNS